MANESLLKEYIQAVLVEDEGGGHPGYTAHDIMASGMSMNPMGAHYGSSGDLYNTFIKPFVDVAKTASGKTKELSVRAQTLVRTAFETVATTIIPILRDDYKEIFEKEKEALKKVKQEYGDVYRSNWDALLNDDLMVAAFFYQPAAFFSVAMARKAPAVLIDMASVLSGGQLDGWLERVKEKAQEKKAARATRGRSSGYQNSFRNNGSVNTPYGYLPIKHKKGELGAIGAGINYYENVVREASEGQGPDLARLLSSDKLREKIEQGQVARGMQQSAQQVVHAALEDVFKKASAVVSARSLDELQQKTGTRLKGIDKLQEMPPQDRQKLEQQVLEATRKSMKEFYVRSLEDHVKKAISSGVPQDSAYVQDHQRIIARIKAL